MKPTEIPFVFFGTDEFAVRVLDELKTQGVKPQQIITTPDKPKGRGLTLTPPPVKVWAEKHQIPFLQPEKLEAKTLKAKSYKLFIVAAYGRILKPEILRLPRHGVLNIHPSLLPKYRGPAPVQTAILNGDEETGVTIMLCDAEVDHGPTLKAISYKLKTESCLQVRDELAKLGTRLLLETMPEWLEGKIKPQEQNHAAATYTKKIKKEDGLVSLEDDPIILDRKFRALTPWPGIYFLTSDRQPIKITAAHLEALPPLGGKASKFVVDRVIPAGRKEMPYADFLRGQRN